MSKTTACIHCGERHYLSKYYGMADAVSDIDGKPYCFACHKYQPVREKKEDDGIWVFTGMLILMLVGTVALGVILLSWYPPTRP